MITHRRRPSDGRRASEDLHCRRALSRPHVRNAASTGDDRAAPGIAVAYPVEKTPRLHPETGYRWRFANPRGVAVTAGPAAGPNTMPGY